MCLQWVVGTDTAQRSRGLSRARCRRSCRRGAGGGATGATGACLQVVANNRSDIRLRELGFDREPIEAIQG